MAKVKLDDCKTREERMFRAMDVAIQWLDDNDPDEARAVLEEVYSPIYNEELKKFDNGENSVFIK